MTNQMERVCAEARRMLADNRGETGHTLLALIRDMLKELEASQEQKTDLLALLRQWADEPHRPPDGKSHTGCPLCSLRAVTRRMLAASEPPGEAGTNETTV